MSSYLLIVLRVLRLVFASAGLAACGIIDNFEERLYDENIHSEVVSDTETLINVVRASRFQQPNFVQISKVSGSQNIDLKIGLPTLTFGPAKTAAQRQFVFSGNLFDTSANASFDSNSLVSSAFQQGIMTPISPKILGLLVAAHTREPVFLAALEAIELRSAHHVYRFTNDSSDDLPLVDRPDCSSVVNWRDYNEPGLGSVEYIGANESNCNYSKFLHFVHAIIAYGLTAELIQMPSGSGDAQKAAGSSAATTSSSSSATSGNTVGRLCFDPGLALPRYRLALSKDEQTVCGVPAGGKETKFTFRIEGDVEVFPIWRSTLGVYRYFGSLLRRNSAGKIGFFSPEMSELNGEPLLNVVRGGSDCAVRALYNGATYCVPEQGSFVTRIMFSILQNLKNLSITPVDLNGSVSVRLVP